jgi:hypothetical protein
MRKLSLSILAAVSAIMMPLAATSQVAPSSAPGAAHDEASYKWEAFAGYGYTSLNQVNQSRYGLQGIDLSVTRNFAKYFGIFGDGAYYSTAVGCCNPGAPFSKVTGAPSEDGKPNVTSVLFGPVFHAHLMGRADGFFRVLLGGEHTGGEEMTPQISFAGGYSGGMDFKVTPRFAVRLSGDDIFSSFSVTGNSAALGDSPHRTRSARAAIGLVYKF